MSCLRCAGSRIAGGVLAGLLGAGLAAAAVSPPEAARGLIERLLPGKADRFVLESIPAEDGRDVFEIESRDVRIVLRGSSGVALASGLNWYLTHYANGHVSFCGDQLRLPDPPPPVPAKVRRASPYRYRYCFNYCAFSYTMPFWDWPQWERVVDWMALHGINMPLAVTGQEAIWQKVYRGLGLSDEQIGRFFVGPAYLPFGWMGCIDGWGGPLPDSWIRGHLDLQKKILARERELGMTPVLQGFTGHVPEALRQAFPAAKFQRLPSWCGFPGTHFLDPMDPLFERVGKAFIEEQTRQFGTDHLYASDTFIEMRPPSGEPEFLSAMGKAIHRAMEAGDPGAVWVLQGWIFHFDRKFWQPPQTRALLGAVPDDRLLLLDLFCETAPVWKTTESFCGRPWAFCLLQSFGAQVSLHGGLLQLQKNLSEALASPQRGKLCGLGLTMEGFGYNPAAFDYLTELAWHPEPPPLEPWVADFARSRYGRLPAAAREAWDLLRQSVYAKPGQLDSVACLRPSLKLRKSLPRDAEAVARACERLLTCAGELADADPYRYDVVHLVRQVMANLAAPLYGGVLSAYERKDREALAGAGRRFLDLLRDLDDLLATRREFLLGPWLSDARRWATNDEERRLYEWNARNLVTLWGPRDSSLHDYSLRQWSGMFRGFYLPRWELFLDRLDKALEAGQPVDAAALESALRDLEVEWPRRTEDLPVAPRGDAVAVAKAMWDKYGAMTGAALAADIPAPAVVPKPAKMEPSGRAFALTAQTPILVSAGAEALGRYLAERLAPATGFAFPVRPAPAGAPPPGSILLALDASRADLGDEGYRLDVSPDGVRIRAPKPAGVFYGIQTLRQLLPAAIEQASPAAGVAWSVPGVAVEDRPRFSWRGYLLDPARHFIPKDSLKRAVDLLALHKLNVLQLHLTDDQGWRVEIRKHPRLTEVGAWRGAGEKRHGGFYAQEDVREVVAYAASRFVTVVPEIEMPGHSVASLAAYPALGCTGGPYEVWTRWGISEDVLCAGNEAVFAFRQDVLDEVLALFPSPFIHIGGDECPRTRWKACPKCQQRIRDEKLKDETALHGYFIRRLDAVLAAKGRRLIGWDEILEGGLAPGATVMSWRGEKGGIDAVRMGHDVVMSPTSHCYLDYPLSKISVEKAYAYDPVPKEIGPEQARHVLGLQGNMWGEGTPREADVDRMTWPRLSALAEAGWSPREGKDFAAFSARLGALLERLDRLGVRCPRPGGAPDAVSLTTGHPATCSSSLPEYPAALANDGRAGDTDRYWATDVARHPGDAWWQVDLEKPLTVGRVVVVGYYGDRRSYGFTVEGSLDGAAWTMLADRHDHAAPSTREGTVCRFEPRPVRYLRVTQTRSSANTGRHLVEVMAYEK